MNAVFPLTIALVCPALPAAEVTCYRGPGTGDLIFPGNAGFEVNAAVTDCDVDLAGPIFDRKDALL